MSTVASPRPAVVGTLVWLAAATAIGATGVLAALPAGPQLVGLTLTIVALFVSTRVAVVRQSIDALPIATLVGVHAVRFIGIAFLALAARGLLSPLFAERAGWGDIAAATLAVVLLLNRFGSSALRRRMFLTWNVFGVLDLIVALGTAAFVVLRGDVPGMEPLLRLPLVLVPMFVVPVLFATHAALFRRLSASPQ